MKTHVVVVVLTTVSMVLAWGCSTADERLGVEIADPPQFAGAEAGADAADAERGLTSYCPTNKCPPGRTTCPSSRFPCDVNLWTDANNCGACGLACPTTRGREVFTCIDGACTMACSATSQLLDCDGFVDNGCEAKVLDDDHCGTCAKKCTDPAKRCADQSGIGDGPFDCGCPAGKVNCDGYCRDTRNDDLNCGACGNYCDRTGGGRPAAPNAYYGCSQSKCDGLKCESGFADCDGEKGNGCEVFLVDDANCGLCGFACPSDQACRLTQEGKPQCMCPSTQTYCEIACEGDLCLGECVDLTSDAKNCGACGASCANGESNELRTCNYGTCAMRCGQGRADCNGSEPDGCEVDTNSDPRNCGGCGQICDAVAGQACVAGRCVVEPCGEADAGEVAR